MRKQVGRILSFAILIGLLANCQAANTAAPQNSTAVPTPSAPPATPTPELPAEVDLLTADGISLNAHYYPRLNRDSEAGTLLLLHAAYRSSRSWDRFRDMAQDEGYAVFTVDLRGHGQSEGEQAFVEAMDNDVEAALGWLAEARGLSEEQITLIGESLGASLALRAGARHPEIPAVILLSPGMQLWEIGIKEAIADYGARPLFLAAAEEDAYPAATVQQLDEKAQGPHELLLLPGNEHGTKMLEAHPDLANQMLTWLHEAKP